MLYLAYDTETTGLPLSQACTNMRDVLNWPRIYELGAILFDEDGFEYGRMQRYIKPDGWKIPQSDEFLKSMGEVNFHEQQGITTEMLMDKGVPLITALDEFLELFKKCEERVCHNASFDFPVVSCELFRSRRFPLEWESKPQHCTKLITEPILQLPSAYPGKFKWPTLQEAYSHFYGKEFDGAHGAVADAQATMDVFLEIQYLL